MFTFLLRTIKRYLLVVAFILPVIAFVSLVVDTHQSLDSKHIGSHSPKNVNTKNSLNITDEELKTVSSKFNNNTIITIDNFPVKKGRLSSRFGMRKDPINGKRKMHSGIDIAAKRGTSVNPLGSGKIIFVGRKTGYGKTVEILHGSTIITRYSHLKKILVKVDQMVSKTDIIAQVGNTGRSTGPHLHLEVAINGEPIDPQIFLIEKLASR